MSNPLEDLTPLPERFENARTLARQRAQYQWENEDRWNLWLDFDNKIDNPDWFDPWFEWETSSPTNIDTSDPPNQMTVNLYYAYCWFKLFGYNNYSICGILTSAIQESNISGGHWEGDLQNGHGHPAHHPYSSLTTFDPTFESDLTPEALGNRYEWYYGGSYPLYSNGTIYTWTAQYIDYRGVTWRLAAGAGTWAAVKRYPIKTATQEVDENGVLVERVMPVGSVNPTTHQILPPAQATLQFDTSNPEYTGNGTGYGICQWTPWTKLPRLFRAGSATGSYGYGLQSFADANRHWQMSGTLHLMAYELCRYINTNDYSGTHTNNNYLGQWLNGNPALGDETQYNYNDMGAYFLWPYVFNDENRHYYKHTSTWNQYANGDYLPYTIQLIEALPQYSEMQEEDKEWCKRQMALAIYRSAFLQATYADFDLQERSYYIMAAIKYWDTHPIEGLETGWDIHDIPRPRDLPFCELDAYHLTAQKYMLIRRRKKSNVRTILL